MLGVVPNPTITPSDVAMRGLAEEMGVGDTFVPTPVGVYFGAGPGVTAPDPYFGGAGPERTGCLECGECMTGCRHNAKNTLVKNYLGLAERAGAVVHPLTTVTGLRPLPATAVGGGRPADTVPGPIRHERGAPARRAAGTEGSEPAGPTTTFTAQHVVFAAGHLRHAAAAAPTAGRRGPARSCLTGSGT